MPQGELNQVGQTRLINKAKPETRIYDQLH